MLGHTSNVNLGNLQNLMLQWQRPQALNSCTLQCGTPSPEDSALITVATQVQPDGLDEFADVSDMYAIVEFGVDLGKVTFEMDLGCACTLTAAEVSLSCAYPRVSKVAPAVQPQVVKVRSLLGRQGSLAHSATRTVGLTSYLQAQDTSPLLALPAYAVDAVEVRPIASELIPVHLYIEYYACNSINSLVKQSTLQIFERDPVPKGARYFRVSNMVAMAGQYAGVQFRLQP